MQNIYLYLITDDLRSRGRSVVEVVSGAVRGGAQCVQYRPQKISDEEFLRNAKELRKVTVEAGVRLIINTRIDIATLAEADGVHLSAEGSPIKEARKLVGSEKIIGFSAHNLTEALNAQNEGANYITLSPLFTTTSASRPRPALGIEQWKEIASQVSVPIFALGGINEDNLKEVLSAGIKRVAVVSAITEADDITAAAKTIAKVLK